MDWNQLNLFGVVLAIGATVGIAIRRRSKQVDDRVDFSPSPLELSSSETVEGFDGSDVTALKTRIAQLEQENKELKLNYRLATSDSAFKSGFFAQVSSTLRSPINAIHGCQVLILDGLCENEEEERELLESANGCTLKMLDMLQKIKLLAQLRHGKIPLKLAPQSVTQLLDQVYQLTALQAAEPSCFGVNLTFPEPDRKIFADVNVLRQVLIYLVEVTIFNRQIGGRGVDLFSEYIPEKKQVQICLETPGSINAWIESTGAFQSEDKSPQFRNISSNLNFPIAQILLDSMGGKLEIMPLSPSEGQPRRFTRIQFSLPIAKKSSKRL
jgi:K+-sensing histidine kinase KdpD